MSLSNFAYPPRPEAPNHVVREEQIEYGFIGTLQHLNYRRYRLLLKMRPVSERIATGRTINTIGLPFFKELCVSVPPLPEQKRSAVCTNSLDDLISAATQELETQKTHKKGLMQRLFAALDAVEA